MTQPRTAPSIASRGGAANIPCEECGLYKLCFAPRLRLAATGGLKRLSLPAGATLPGMPGPTACAVRSGALEHQWVMPEGEVDVTGYRLPGEALSLAEGPGAASWVALQPSHLCMLPRGEVARLLAGERRTALALMRLLLQDSEGVLAGLQRARHGSALQRMASVLLDLRRRLRTGSHLVLPMSRRSLAAHMDMTLATASRALSTLETRGILRRRGRRVEIRDPDALAHVAERPAES
ncbi:Crp/Fnr family transcriptional regulator [Spiribacter halobius]|uniref:HTH crp-type domain-containing protein n=1 Tax=Sediminicurvatus halobius TaxID=2182432 RepID=A0A2U2MZX9_9GAMM|nr:Crp/Fnr family transcriptional regulator [Spiribacter halobius]PWG62357.1 hypothetical protein DEM34_12860 [Spiribacter halobius]UEX79719.1 Crp/Fnr family transcriptional regulator [Spiribacter halobius]